MCCKIKPFPANDQKFFRFFSSFPHISPFPATRRPAQSAATRAHLPCPDRAAQALRKATARAREEPEAARGGFQNEEEKPRQGTQSRKRINAKNDFCAPKSNPQSEKSASHAPRATRVHRAAQPPPAAQTSSGGSPKRLLRRVPHCLPPAAEKRGKRGRKEGGKKNLN